MLRTGDDKSSPTRTESKYSDSMGGVQGSLNVFKQGFNGTIVSEKSAKTPGLGEGGKFSPSSKVDEIPVDMEESEEYRDDDFDSSDGSAALAKVTVSASGKLPPLSGSYPYGADEKSLSQSFQQSKDEKKMSSGRARETQPQPSPAKAVAVSGREK